METHVDNLMFVFNVARVSLLAVFMFLVAAAQALPPEGKETHNFYT